MKINYKAQLNMNALLEKTDIRKHILIHSPFVYFADDYKFIGKYNDNDDLLLLFTRISGSVPIVVISKTDCSDYNIEIRYAKATKASFVFVYILMAMFLLIAIICGIWALVIAMIVFATLFTSMIICFFKIFAKKIKRELDDFTINSNLSCNL